MPTRNRFSRIGGLVRALGSAIAVSSAVERGKLPAERDLRNIGIDPIQFNSINR